ncbi:MAG: MarR family transcriptional regulator [Acidimicrobiia bacterium]|nr:MarR family transcriptional regulator [Acidimicrobiia bacterium]
MTQWLNETEARAWRALITLVLVELPKLESTFSSFDLLHVEYGLLVALSESPDDALRMSDLAEAANLSQSRLSHRMRRLVERGLIEQRPCSEDRRVTYAALTPSGRALIEEAAPHHVADVRSMIFDSLTEDQTVALADALEAIVSSKTQSA